MASKRKKGGKKGADDWDAGLGEPAPPVAAAGDAQDGDSDEEGGTGGLMALMRKNKEKRKKKGIVEEETVEPEEDPSVDLASKAPEEANMDDEFALPGKKGKGHQKKQVQKPASAETGEDGRILTKAEKEKLRKERERQRKREQVYCPNSLSLCHVPPDTYPRRFANRYLPTTRLLPRRSPNLRRLQSPLLRPLPSPRPRLPRRKPRHRLQLRAERRGGCRPISR